MHGGPEIVGLQAQEQLKYLFVSLWPHLAVFHLCPSRPTTETLIIDEDTSILHRRLPLNECDWLYI